MNITTCIRAVEALVLSHLDFGSSLLHGVTKKCLSRLDRVLHSAARVVMCAGKRNSVESFMAEHKWLPMDRRARSRLLCITHTAVHHSRPTFLRGLLKDTQKLAARNLRSTEMNLLHVPQHRTKTGSRAFSVSAPFLWNAIPFEIRQSCPQNFKDSLFV